MSGQTSESIATPPPSPAAEPRLRLWPGALVVAVLWLIRLFVTLSAGSPSHFFYGLIVAPLAAIALVFVWWLFLSRLRWRDRGLVCGVFALAVLATVLVNRQNFPPMALIMYAAPVALSVWVGWLLLTFRLTWPIRRSGLLAAIVLVACAFSVLRVDGMTGSFDAKFSWRWAPTAEGQMLSELAAAPRPTPAPSETPIEKLELQAGDWPGFRGAERDSRFSGAPIASDWAQSPPRELWRHRIGPGWSSFAVIGDRAFTQEQRGENEMVVCYDVDSGAEVWSHSDATRFTEVVAGPGPRGTPTFDDGRIYALGASGNLNCLDAATGKLHWTHDIAKDSGAELPQWGFSSSPLIVQGIVTVFAGGDAGKSVLGYNAATGDLAWSAGEGKLSYCSTQLARLGGVEQLLITTDAGLTAFAPTTGEVLWTHPWQTEHVARIVQPMLLGGTDVLIGTGMGVGTRRISVGHEKDTWPVKELWTTRQIKPYYNDFVVQGEYLYGFDGAMFMCVSLADGQAKWRKRGYGNGQALLLAEQNLVLVLTEEGDAVLVETDPKAHREAGRFKAIEGKTWNHPVIAHGKLLVRNAEEIACFALRPAPAAEQTEAPQTTLNR